MNNFGEIIRKLRIKKGMGLSETVSRFGIDHAYLSRIERDKESLLKAEIIKILSQILEINSNILFRSSLLFDPDLISFLKNKPKALELVHLMMTKMFSNVQPNRIILFVVYNLIK